MEVESHCHQGLPNLGAARVVADYDPPSAATQAILDYNNAVPPFNFQVWMDNPQLGCMNGPSDYLIGGSIRSNGDGTINSCTINGDSLTRNLLPVPGVLPITFRLWCNKELVFQGLVSNSDIFRLPTGFRTDTFEVAVSGAARVRAIHIGETPYGLRTA